MEGFENLPKSGLQDLFDEKRTVVEMPALPVAANGKPIVELSHSGKNVLSSCARKYQLNKRFAQPEHSWDSGLPAVGGQAIHEYLQAKAVGASDMEAEMAFFYAFDFDIEAKDSYNNRSTRGFEACLYSAQHAAEVLAFDPDEVALIKVEGDGVEAAPRPAIEAKFCLVLSHPSFKYEYHYRGAIDLVAYRLFGNQFNVKDFKTHRNYRDGGDENMEHKYKWDDQLTPYGLVIQHLQGGNLDSFQVTYTSLFVDIHDPVLKEYTFNRTRADVDSWVQKMLLLIGQIEQYADRNTWPRTSNGCEFYANRCKYYDKCHIEDHEILQDALLGQHDPKPYKPYPAWVTINLELE